MLKLWPLFIALTFLSTDAVSFPQPDLQELSATIGEGPVQILGRVQFDRRDCSPVRTQASIWGDSVGKSPLNPRSRLGLGVGLQEKAQDLWSRRCFEKALEFYDRATRAYGEVIQLSAGDPSPVIRTFRLQASMNQATIFIQTHDFDAARTVLVSVLSERAEFLPAIARLAEVEMRSGNPLAALSVTDRLRGKRFEDVGLLSVGQFWAVRAEAHCDLGDVAQANWEVEQARKNDPSIAKAKCTAGKPAEKDSK